MTDKCPLRGNFEICQLEGRLCRRFLSQNSTLSIKQVSRGNNVLDEKAVDRIDMAFRVVWAKLGYGRRHIVPVECRSLGVTVMNPPINYCPGGLEGFDISKT